MVDKETKEDKEVWVLQEVPTQYTPAIVNTKTEEVHDIGAAMVKVLNYCEKILKAVQ